MAWLKRTFLFLALNFLVVLVISFVLSILNIRPYIEASGLNYTSLMIFCLIWGMGGAFISLALSRIMAKWIMGVKLIDPATSNLEHRALLDTVRRLTQKAHLPMPQVGLYHSKEINAFATGPTQKRSLIALSTGLLNRMKESEIEAIIGHEITHIANGDMVTMTLLQGVVNAFVMFLARAFAYALSGLSRSRDHRSHGSYLSYTLFVYLFEIVFMILGSLLIAAYSRYREFRADRGGARLASKDSMIGALQTLRVLQEIRDPEADKPAIAAFKISHPTKRGFFRLFATHPPLEERIARLQG